MSFLLAAVLTGTVLALLGLGLLTGHSVVASAIKGFPRSKAATAVFFGSAALWFLSRVWTLSLADFGEYRGLLFFFFTLLAILSFFYVPDFLSVRGLAGLVLLSAGPLLDSTYMHYEWAKLALNAVIYVFIFCALWLGAQPYRLRDWIEWLYRSAPRPRRAGAVLLALGLAVAALPLAS
jgi:hypothetical protein